jgi:lipopolysaccharide transport system ATP-binding protein
MMIQDKSGAVVFDHVSKRYRLGQLGSLRATLAWLRDQRGRENGRHNVYALQDVSFQVEPGEALGLIGPNGAGKTTTLKLLSNITQPTSGRVQVYGRLSSLIELGAGFHPDLTGRENIYLNGAILGLKRPEIRQRFDEIVAFAELERFIDTPVKRYSSGMYVRLGFAVAAHVESDIILIDEVLSVGDAAFRQRSLERIRQLQQAGTTVLFVSHNMHLVRKVCDRALLLSSGQVRSAGTPAAVIAAYEKLALEGARIEAGLAAEAAKQPVAGRQTLWLKDVTLAAADGMEPIDSRRPVTLRIRYESAGCQPIGRIDVRIVRQDGTLCCTADSSLQARNPQAFRELSGSGTILLMFPALQLTTATYVAVVQITDASDAAVIASGESEPFPVYAEGSGPERGIYVPEVHWTKLEDEWLMGDGDNFGKLFYFREGEAAHAY